jgi:hypothetical protein
VNESQKLTQLERAFEAALIEVMKATDGAGLKVMIVPSRPPKDSCYRPTMESSIPRPEDFAAKITELLGANYIEIRTEYRGEEALARNIGLLAKAWEASVRYWDFKRELEK